MLYASDKAFDTELIRDTSSKISTVINSEGFIPKTLAISNKLDEDVTLQLQGSPLEDFSEIFDIGTNFVVTASTNSYQNADVYFSFLRLTAICATAPTSGDLTVYLERVE